MTTFRRRLTGMLAAVLIVGILIGLPVILVEIGGNPLPDQLPSLSDVGKALTSPDDGTLAVAAISLIAWAAWLILAGSILLEAHVSAAGHHPARAAGAAAAAARRPKPGHRRAAAVRRHPAATRSIPATGQPNPWPPPAPTTARPTTRHGPDRRAHANGRRKPWQGRVGNRPLSGAERGLAVDDRP